MPGHLDDGYIGDLGTFLHEGFVAIDVQRRSMEGFLQKFTITDIRNLIFVDGKGVKKIFRRGCSSSRPSPGLLPRINDPAGIVTISTGSFSIMDRASSVVS
jgi:hypothetical protein